MTGESASVDKGPGDDLYSGTFVVEGEGLAVVSTTGAATRLASVAALTTAVRRHTTPLARELRRLVRTTTFIAVGAGLAFVLASTALGVDIESGLVFGIGVMVALVPEALLPTVTLSLAIGAQRMSEKKALVRRLEAVETLGSTTFLCTDKTGTLTQDKIFLERRTDVWGETSDAVLEYAYFITIVCANRPPRAGRGSTAAVLRHTRGFSLSVSTVGDQSPMRAARCGRFRSSLQGLTATSSTRRPATHQFAKFRVKPCSGGT
jgi:magnesium-transporting ATPase (P-type)